MTPQETFITRLRRHRERNHISLDDIAAQTRIKRDQLEAFERGARVRERDRSRSD
jgi:cytoskeletal protein RodZ